MIKLSQAVIVEGKYDAIKLANFIDALIITTEGFGIFKNREKQKFLRRLADEKGIIIITDSDSAGFMIRSFVSKIADKDKVINVYIPDIYGKEKRKEKPSAEGKLGVEGVSEEIILDALKKAGVTADRTESTARKITNIDLFEYGFSGRENSKEKRKQLLKSLALPERLSTASLVKVLNSFVTYEEFLQKAKEINLCESDTDMMYTSSPKTEN
ncbi:MAG: toprim domain-containing protein [Acutalibacteraceae bacterium]